MQCDSPLIMFILSHSMATYSLHRVELWTRSPISHRHQPGHPVVLSSTQEAQAKASMLHCQHTQKWLICECPVCKPITWNSTLFNRLAGLRSCRLKRNSSALAVLWRKLRAMYLCLEFIASRPDRAKRVDGCFSCSQGRIDRIS